VARNRAISDASGDILYLSDDDCLLAHDALERHVACQEERPGVWLGRVVFRADGRDEPWTPGPNWWQLNGANASLPAAAVAEVGGFDDALEGYGGEDLLLGWRLHRAGAPYGVCSAAKVVHLGPNPVAGADLLKARQAGANAVRIAARHPELALRLGVHPLSLAGKRVLYGAPWSGLLARIGGGRIRYERAYFRGAVEHLEARNP
jgi:glycosyltransferase involved in cell wall biosynthesis